MWISLCAFLILWKCRCWSTCSGLPHLWYMSLHSERHSDDFVGWCTGWAVEIWVYFLCPDGKAQGNVHKQSTTPGQPLKWSMCLLCLFVFQGDYHQLLVQKAVLPSEQGISITFFFFLVVSLLLFLYSYILAYLCYFKFLCNFFKKLHLPGTCKAPLTKVPRMVWPFDCLCD